MNSTTPHKDADSPPVGLLDRRSFLKLAALSGSGLLMPEISRSRPAPGPQGPTRPWDHYLLGTAYYPEWWDDSEWETDFHQMRQLGFNTVRMGEFAWALKVLQRNVDVVPEVADFSAYRLLAAPNFRLINDSVVSRLRDFVAGGGILVLNYRAGTQNPDNSMRRVLPPGPLAELAGVIAESNLDLIQYSDLKNELGIAFAGQETIFRPRTVVESLTLRGAEAIATVRGGRLEGKPAVTRHRFKQGWVFYAGTDCAEDGFHEALARVAGAAGNLAPLVAAPYGVEVTCRENDETFFYFLLNLTERACPHIALPRRMDEVITGQTGLEHVSLGPLQATVLASPRA